MSVVDTRGLARQLGGGVAGPNSIVMPSPAHSPSDRSLILTFRPEAPDGFVVHSHAGDDFRECRDMVRALLSEAKIELPRLTRAPKAASQEDPARIAYFPVVPGIQSLTVLAELDDNGASKRALRACAERWLRAGANVFAVTPKRGGNLNDLIREDQP